MANHIVPSGHGRAFQRQLTSSELCKSLEKIILARFGKPIENEPPIHRLAFWLSQRCKLTSGQKFRRYFTLSWRPKFYHLVSLVLIGASVETLLNLHYQYAYDTNRAIHDKIISKLMGSSRLLFRVNDRNGSEFLDQIEAKADEARWWLKHFGSAHCEWSFASQIIHMYVWIPALVFILVGPVFMKFHQLAYFSWIRWLFDEAGECKHWAEFTAFELERFEGSMSMSSQIKFDLDQKNLVTMSNVRSAMGRRRTSLPVSVHDFSGGGRDSRREFQQIVRRELATRSNLMQQRHSSARRQLRLIALDGQLGTLMRTRRSLGSMALAMLALSTVQSLCSVCMIIWIYRQLESLFAKRDRHAEFSGPKDALESCCLVYFSLLCSLVCSTNKSYNLVTTFDQIRSLNRVDGFIRDTIAGNERLCRDLLTRKSRRASTISTVACEQLDSERTGDTFVIWLGARPLVDPSNEDVARSLEQLELGLLRVILEYRLFLAQYELVMRPVRFYVLFYSYMIFSLALLVRIHAPYMYPELKMLGACLSYICMAPQYIFMLPLCHLHHRCMQLYERLYSLVAQMTYYESCLNLRNCVSLGMALSTLKRCLIRPEHAKAELTCRVLFLDITYNTMLKITLWVSLLIIPMLNSKQSSDDLMSSFMGDPLGIFRFK